jgi:hypothetical protein
MSARLDRGNSSLNWDGKHFTIDMGFPQGDNKMIWHEIWSSICDFVHPNWGDGRAGWTAEASRYNPRGEERGCLLTIFELPKPSILQGRGRKASSGIYLTSRRRSLSLARYFHPNSQVKPARTIGATNWLRSS